jgi:formate dehydrogenase major subunit
VTASAPACFEDLAREVPCMAACPAHVRVPAYLRAIAVGDFAGAAAINQTDVLFPGVLGRICTRPCEDVCRHGRTDEPIAICHLKRVAADRAPIPSTPARPLRGPSGRVVAVVGAGPAGIAVAHHLARLGHAVTVLDAGAEPGGLLATGIPAFRLPPALRRREVAAALGVAGIALRCGVRVGDGPGELSVAALRAEHDAVVLCPGCPRAVPLAVPGATLAGVLAGLAFVLAANAGAAPAPGARVVVVGAGFTAIDAARSARRLGAAEVSLVYRRERRDASARAEDLAATLAEGVTFHERRVPVAFLPAPGGDRLAAVRLARTEVVVEPATGRRTARVVPGSEHDVPADTAIVAIGQSAGPPLAAGLAVTDAAAGATALDGVFVAGDAAYGTKSVVDAVGHGARVARAVDGFLSGGGPPRVGRATVALPVEAGRRRPEWDAVPRARLPELAAAARLADPAAEVELGLDAAGAASEARRCYLCDDVYRIEAARCVYCEKCVEVCPTRTITLYWDGRRGGAGGRGRRLLRFWRRPERDIRLDTDGCIRCGRCVEVCPVDCIPVVRLTLHETVAPAAPAAAALPHGTAR